MTDEGYIDKFLGIKITQLDEKIFNISQTYMIDRIVLFLGVDNNNYGMKKMPSQIQLASHFCIKNYLEIHAKKVGIVEPQLVC